MDHPVEQNNVSAGFGEMAIVGSYREVAVVERWPALLFDCSQKFKITKLNMREHNNNKTGPQS